MSNSVPVSRAAPHEPPPWQVEIRLRMDVILRAEGGLAFVRQAIKDWCDSMSKTRSMQIDFDLARREALEQLKTSSPTTRQFKFSTNIPGALTYDAQRELWERSIEADLEEQLPEHLRMTKRPRLKGIFSLKDKYRSDVECIVAVAAIHDRHVERHNRPGLMKRPEDLMIPDDRWIYAEIWQSPDDIPVWYEREIEDVDRDSGKNDELLMMDAMRRVEDCFKQQCALNPPGLRATTPNQAKQKSPTRRARKRTGASTPKPLTEKQAKAIHLYGVFKGNTAEVGREMGVGRKTADQHIKAALEKLGKHAMTPGKTRSLPTDKRGQESITEETDKRR